MYQRPLVPEDLHRDGQAERRSLLRAIAAIAVGRARKEEPQRICEGFYPRDDDAKLIVRAVTNPTSTTDFPKTISIALLPILAPDAASTRLFRRAGLQIDLSGIAQVGVPHIAAAPPAPPFVGEGQPIGVVGLGVGVSVIGPAKKLAIAAALAAELESASGVTAETFIGRTLNDASSRALDAAVFSDAVGDDIRCGGLLENVTPLTGSSKSGLEQIADDASALAGAISAAGIATDDMVIVAGGRAAKKLQVMAPGLRNDVLASPAVADDLLIGIAPSAIGTGYAGLPQIEAARQATLHYADLAAPIGAPGTPPTMAVPTRELFQEFSIGVKVTTWCAWAVCQPGAVASVQIGW